MGFLALPPAPAWPTLHLGFAQPLSPPRASPALWREAPPTHLPPSACFFHLRFHSGELQGPKGDQGKTGWEGQLEEKPDPGGCGRSPGCCWRRLAPAGSQPKRCVCQALPGVKSGQLETSGDARGRTGLVSAASSVATNTHTTSHTCSQCVNRNGEWGYWRAWGEGHLRKERFQL